MFSEDRHDYGMVLCCRGTIDLAKGKYWQPEEEEEAVGQNGSQFASQVQYMNNSILLGQLKTG